jgi:hypothetical protein
MHPCYKHILNVLVQWRHTSAFILVTYINYKYIESVLCVLCVLCVHVVHVHDFLIQGIFKNCVCTFF